jgi:hypothetical protein
MKTRAIAASAIIALVLTGAASIAFAHSSLVMPPLSSGQLDDGSDGGDGNDQQTTTQTLQSTNQTGNDDNNDMQTSISQLTVGQSIALSNLTGSFVSISNESVDGTVTGSLVARVTGILSDGVTLSIVSGSFDLGNATIFTVTGGSLVLSHDGETASGSGTAGSAKFIIQINDIRRLSSSSDTGAMRLDIKSGTNEFLVNLGAHDLQEGDSGDSSGDSGD